MVAAQLAMFPFKRTQLEDEKTQRFQDAVISFSNQLLQNPTADGKLLTIVVPTTGYTTAQDIPLNHAFGRLAQGFICVYKGLASDFFVSPTANPQQTTTLLLRCTVALAANLQLRFWVF